MLPTNHPELDYFRSASHEFKVHVHRYGDIQGGYGKVSGCWAKHRLSMDLHKSVVILNGFKFQVS